MRNAEGVTTILDRMAGGDPDARREAFRQVYDPMCGIARAILKRESRDCSLQTIDLVHETLTTRLLGDSPLRVNNAQHLLSLAARAMKQTVTDNSRRRDTRRRHVDAFDSRRSRSFPPETALAVRRAMDKLKEVDPDSARIVVCRDLQEMTWEETAGLLAISVSKAREDYAFAKAWLREHLRS